MTLATVAFKTEFAVDMTCQNCVNAVQSALRDISGIERYDIDLENKRVTVTGKTPPSHLLSALKSTNRQVIVRGSSSASPNVPATAAVSILESPLPLPLTIASTSNSILANLPASSPSSTADPLSAKPLPGMNEEEHTQKVFGICRFVQIAPKTVLMDLTVRLPPPARVGLANTNGNGNSSNHSDRNGGVAWNVYVSSTGNMVNPPSTTGKPFFSLGSITPDKDGYGDLFKEVDGELWEWIGRGCVVEAQSKASASLETSAPPAASAGGNGSEPKSALGRIFAGVVARSAGTWGNEKTVCACSGRTMWEEGRDMEKRL